MRRTNASHECHEQTCDPQALASPALVASVHLCHSSPQCLLLAEVGAPCGARLAAAEQSKVFGQVTPRCQAFNRPGPKAWCSEGLPRAEGRWLCPS